MSQEVSKTSHQQPEDFSSLYPLLSSPGHPLGYPLLLHPAMGFCDEDAKDSYHLVFLIVLVYFPFFLRSSSLSWMGLPSDIILEMNPANYEDWDRGTEQRLKVGYPCTRMIRK